MSGCGVVCRGYDYEVGLWWGGRRAIFMIVWFGGRCEDIWSLGVPCRLVFAVVDRYGKEVKW